MSSIISSTTSQTEPKPKSKRRKSSSSGRKKRGWGPFQSVLKERSVAFNLTLDVQNLQQQVQDLTTLRDILSVRTTLRRHSPEGSLFHVVKEYFHVFRTGWAVHESGRKRVLGERDQREFLHCVMDPQVDVDNGLQGPDVMAEQLIMYSTFIKFIRLTMKSYDIVVADESVVIQTKARLRFQVLRNTIEMIFPHVIGDECLVAQLVGQEVEPMVAVTFFFNPEGKCCKYKVELDFVEAFSSLVKDPKKLETLLGRALIADNCMFGLIHEPVEVQTTQANQRPTLEEVLEDEWDRLVDELHDLRSLTSTDDCFSEKMLLLPPSKAYHCHNDALFQRVVNDYFLVFEDGYRRSSNRGHLQTDFISQIFVADTRARDPQGGGMYVHKRWRALSECFEVLGFRQHSAQPVEYNDQDDMCIIRSTAFYTLRITPHTLMSVFPHVMGYKSLVSALVGSMIMVPSQLVFSIEMDTGRIYRFVERMDFVEPLDKLLQDREALSFVMSQALLCLDGVSCRRPAQTSAILPPLAGKNVNTRVASDKYTAENRAMTMADILHA